MTAVRLFAVGTSIWRQPRHERLGYIKPGLSRLAVSDSRTSRVIRRHFAASHFRSPKENPASWCGVAPTTGTQAVGGRGRVIGPRLTTQFTSETHSPQKLFRKSKDQIADLS